MQSHCDRLLDYLSDGRPHNHHELYSLHMIVHSRIADLRKRGHTIERWQETGPDGHTDYVYCLVPQTTLFDLEQVA